MSGQDWQKKLCRLCFEDTDKVVILRAEKRKEVKEWRARVGATEAVETGKKRGGGDGGDMAVWCWGCRRHMSGRVWWGCPVCKGECLNLQHYEN